MADALLHQIVVEGDTDAALLKALKALSLVPATLELAKPAGGAGELPRRAAARARAGLGTIVMRDLDDLESAAVREQFGRALKEHAPTAAPSGVGWLVQEGTQVGRIALVLAGLSAGEAIATQFGIESFAADDYVLSLLESVPEIYRTDFEQEGVTRAVAFEKLTKTLALLRGQGVEVRTSKRMLDLFRGIVGFRAAPATLAEKVVKSAAERNRPRLEALTRPLCDDLRAALAFVSGAALP